MKKTIFTFLLILTICSSINAQDVEYYTSRLVNRDAKLVHHAAIYSKDSIKSDEFFALLQSEIAKKELPFSLFEDVDESPDFLFILDDYEVAYQKATEFYSIPVFVNIETTNLPAKENVKNINAKDLRIAVKKAISMMSDFYCIGSRPKSTTVFTDGENGYVSYRIPSVIMTASDRILAFTETRTTYKSDIASNDIIMKYSDDRGATWSDMIVIADFGDISLNNPTVVYVEETNEVILFFVAFPQSGEGTSKKGSQGDDVIRIFTTKSTDEGLTWSSPENITSQVKLPTASSINVGPGVGIREVGGRHDGRIIMPFHSNESGWYNYFVYSDDLGKTWNIMDGHSQYGTNESQLVQIREGEFLVNARSHRFVQDNGDNPPNGWSPWNFNKVNRTRGLITVTVDETGQKADWEATQSRYDMPDPLCQGGIIRYDVLYGESPSMLLYTNPASMYTDRHDKRSAPYRGTPPIRMNGSMGVSYDDGATWPIRKRFYGNRYTEYQYSVPVKLDKDYIGVLFEANTEIKFVVFDLKWISSKID